MHLGVLLLLILGTRALECTEQPGTCCPGKYTIGCSEEELDDLCCLECSPGKYSNETNSTYCRECPKGKSQDASGQITCESCAFGQYGDQTSLVWCKGCPTGRYGDEWGLSASECKKCPAGQYGDQTNLEAPSECKGCPAGRWSDQVGLSAYSDCKACPRGKFSGLEGRYYEGQCNSCPDGRWSDQTPITHSDQCTMCAPGKYFSEQQTCTNCTAGQESAAGQPCQECILGKVSESGGPCTTIPQERCDEFLSGSYPQGQMCLRPPNPYWGISGCARYHERYIWRESLHSHEGPVVGHPVSPYNGLPSCPGEEIRDETACREAQQYIYPYIFPFRGGGKFCGWNPKRVYGMFDEPKVYLCRRVSGEVKHLTHPYEETDVEAQQVDDCSPEGLQEFDPLSCFEYAFLQGNYSLDYLPADDARGFEERQVLTEFYSYKEELPPGCAIGRQITWNQNPRAVCSGNCWCKSDLCRLECQKDARCYAFREQGGKCLKFEEPKFEWTNETTRGGLTGPIFGRGEVGQMEEEDFWDLGDHLELLPERREYTLVIPNHCPNDTCTIIIEDSLTPPCPTTGY